MHMVILHLPVCKVLVLTSDNNSMILLCLAALSLIAASYIYLECHIAEQEAMSFCDFIKT